MWNVALNCMEEVVSGKLKCQEARPFTRDRTNPDSSGLELQGYMSRLVVQGIGAILSHGSLVRVALESGFFLSFVKGRATWHFGLPNTTPSKRVILVGVWGNSYWTEKVYNTDLTRFSEKLSESSGDSSRMSRVLTLSTFSSGRDMCGTKKPCAKGRCENIGPGIYRCHCQRGYDGRNCGKGWHHSCGSEFISTRWTWFWFLNWSDSPRISTVQQLGLWAWGELEENACSQSYSEECKTNQC